MADREPLFDPSVRNLNDINLLAEAPPEKIKELEGCCEWQEYGADEIVVNLKDESTNVFFVVKGKLRAMDYLTDENNEVALAELEEGNSFGELSAIDLKVRSARVVMSNVSRRPGPLPRWDTNPRTTRTHPQKQHHQGWWALTMPKACS